MTNPSPSGRALRWLELPLHLGVVAALGIGGGALAGALGLPPAVDFEKSLESLPAAGAWLAGAVLAAFLSARLFGGPRDLGLPAAPGMYRDLLVGLGGGTAAVLVVLGAGLALGAFDLHVPERPITEAGSAFARATLLLAAMAAFEELLFRGFVQRKLAAWIGDGKAIAIASSAFGIVHGVVSPEAPATAIAGTALAGAVLGLAYARTGDLWLTTGLHLGWNLALGWLAGLPVSGHSLLAPLLDAAADPAHPWLTGGWYGPEASLLGLAVFAIGLAILHRFGPRNPRAS